MSICNECWGKGWIKKQGVQFDCRKCKGTGVIENEPQTNEEWFCGLSTEEKAHFLSVECARAMCEQQLKITNRNTVDYWKLWLKEIHKE